MDLANEYVDNAFKLNSRELGELGRSMVYEAGKRLTHTFEMAEQAEGASKRASDGRVFRSHIQFHAKVVDSPWRPMLEELAESDPWWKAED